MADKKKLNAGFNKTLEEFLNDIISSYPENDDIIKAKASFETIKKLNVTLFVKAWFQKVYTPYQEVIDAGDITFFFDKDYSQDLQSVSNAGEIMAMIDKLREPVRQMSDSDKDVCMKYIQKLSKISFHYSSM